MFKGLFALLTTGLIFKPMLLLGGIIGIVSYVKFDAERLQILYTDWHLYALFLIVAGLYAYFFKQTYLQNTYKTDWKETSKTMFLEFLLLSFSFVIGMLLASFFDFSLPEPKTEHMHYSEQSEILELQKRAEDMQKQYDRLLNQIK